MSLFQNPRIHSFLILISALSIGAPSMAEETAEKKFTNHLAGETSPYLLQHQHNPVDWYPWGEEALAKARAENKPIFLSIGYSACHWCHVMEHESFENEAIAAYLNEHFVNIKVDREERPDLDEIYMTATQLLTQSGGWPMTVFMTPDLKPFYAGTYFPPDDRYGRPGFSKLTAMIAGAFKDRRDEVNESAAGIAKSIEKVLAADVSSGTVTHKAVDNVVEQMEQRFDAAWGGFGGAPKFPHTMDLMLLMRHVHKTGDEEVLEAVTHSLDKMARGGMYDQIGGGFHRYSVDARWLIPHFEKMLYDNALLSKTYLEAFQLSGNEWYAVIAKQVLDYVIREMQDGEGGYYSSTDADSMTEQGEKEEGEFFVWTPTQVDEVLGEEDGRVVSAYYNVTAEGNFEKGKSALWIPKDPEKVASELELTLEALNEIVERSKPKLYEARSKRIPPGLDDKILTDWNGLMISAMAFAAHVLDEPRYLESAGKAADSVLAHQWDGERLLHTRRAGVSRLEGMLSDYANLAMGLIDLYLASGEPARLKTALDIHSAMAKRFEDSEKGGFYNTVAGQADLLVRTKTGTDNATPSGNSIAAYNALRLGAITGKEEFEKQAVRTFLAFGESVRGQGMAYPMMLHAVERHHSGGRELVLVSPEPGDSLDAFLDPIREVFKPHLVWIAGNAEGIGDLSTLVADRKSVEGKPTAYLCRDRTCGAPTTDPETVRKNLLD